MPLRLVPDAALPPSPRPLLIALPGAGCSPAIFDRVAVPGWDICAVDWAHGPGAVDPSSVAQRLAALLPQRCAPTAIAGHSTGAAISVLVAALQPQHVSALVVSNTGVHSRKHGDPTLLDRIRTQWDAEQQQTFLRACFQQQPASALWQALCGYLSALPREALLESVEGLRALDLTAAMARVRAPTLIAHGRDDRRRNVDDAQALAAGIRGASLVLLPGAHTPMVDCPADYNEALTRFLAPIGTSPAASPTF